jgi:iron complex outermembrane recepter protein
MKKLFVYMSFALAAAVLAVAAGAQQPAAVSGTVRDEAGRPIPHVVLRSGGRAVLTDDGGRFTLRLGPGRHRIEVVHVGYLPLTRPVNLPADAGSELEITLVATPLPLPGLQVTASPGGRQVLHTAQSLAQLSGSALERSLGAGVAQTLEALPGLAVRYNGPGAAAPMIRGLSGDRILVLQDGQRVADLAGSADDHFVSVDALGAQRIEVVRGPASLLYGTNALGGVVNVISADAASPAGRTVLSGTLLAESAQPGGSATLRGQLPATSGWTLTLLASGRSSGDVRVGAVAGGARRLTNTFQHAGSGAVGAEYAGESARGRLLVQTYATEYGLPLPPEEPERVVLRGGRRDISGHLELPLRRGSLRSLRVSGLASDYGHDEFVEGERAMSFGLRTGTADVLLRHGPGDRLGEGAVGLAGLFREYAATGADQLTPAAAAQALGVFAYQELPVARERLLLQAGMRLDGHRVASRAAPAFGPAVVRAFTALSGSAGIVAPLLDGVVLWASAARSHRAATVEELFSDALHLGTASYERGDPELSPEFARGTELGVRAARARASLELSAYRNDIRNFIHFEQRGDTVLDGSTWPVLAYVQQPASFVGAELSAEWAAGHGLVLGVRGDLVRGQRTDGTPVPFLPAPRLGGHVRWERAGYSLGAGVRHAFAQTRVGLAYESPTAAYTLFDIDAGLRVLRGRRVHSVSVRARNLTDVLYRDAASRVKDFAPNPGRDIALLYRFVL